MNSKDFRKKIEIIAQDCDSSDIDWLMCEVTRKKRTELSQDFVISKIEQKKLIKYAKKLKKGVSVSQIIGYVDFLDTKIAVNKNVLSPRSETEELADLLVKDILARENKCSSVLDLCTGSGCIAIAVNKHTSARVVASDISSKALKVARKNVKQNKCDVEFIKSNMFQKIWGHFDYIVCNPPYIKFGDSELDKKVKKYEPALALYAQDDGYEFYKIIAQKAKYYMLTGGKIFLEVGKGMAQNVAGLFNEYSSCQIVRDMQNIERFVIITK